MENKQMEVFKDTIKKMSEEQLRMHLAASKNVNGALSIAGIFFILIMIYYPTIPAIVIGSCCVYLLGKASEGISKAMVLVRAQLLKIQKTG